MKWRIVMILATVMLWGSSVMGKTSSEMPVRSEVDSLSRWILQPLSSDGMDQNKPIVPLTQRNPLRHSGNIIDHHVMTPAFQNIFEMIQGRVPGVQVYGGFMNYQIRIRGSMRPPLVVIDGLRLFNYDDHSLNNMLLSIPPADVDYIEVIKNIGQTTLYGPGAGNGVIVVHTKRGEMVEESR